MKISERPEFKSKKPPLTFRENDTVLKAVKAMAKDNFGSVVIVDKDKKVKGIFTERDVMNKLVNNVMNSTVKVANKDDDLVVWLRQMSNERFRHVPVVDKSGKLINIMSQGDFVSYTWPNLLYQVKEMAKENYFKANQVVLIVVGLLIYTLITLYFAMTIIS